MADPQHLDKVTSHEIPDDVWRARDYQFTRAGDLARATA